MAQSREQQKAMFAQIRRRWDKKSLHSLEGDHQAVIFTNKKDPSLTVELHPFDNDDSREEDEPFRIGWIVFPAKSGRGIPTSPTVIEESGGETKADALKELKKQLIETDEDIK